MTERQRGYTDNLAGVVRNLVKSHDWLVGWDEAQRQRFQDEREIRVALNQLQEQESVISTQRRS